MDSDEEAFSLGNSAEDYPLTMSQDGGSGSVVKHVRNMQLLTSAAGEEYYLTQTTAPAKNRVVRGMLLWLSPGRR
jgi:hypothetical protein